MAQYQTGVIYERTGRTAEAVKVFRDLSDHSSVFVPRPLVLLELAQTLRQSDPKQAASVYAQLKLEFPNTPISEQADRALETLLPQS